MNLAYAWDTVKGNPNIVVQVLDTGLDLDHEDLQMNIWRNAGETDCTDGVDNDNNGFVDDCHGYNLERQLPRRGLARLALFGAVSEITD